MRPRTIIAAVAALAAAAIAAFVLSRGGDPARPRAAARAPQTQTSPTELRPISVDDVTPHLRALVDAAGADATRAAGTPGDAATREAVVDTLRAAGWRVTVQPVRFPFFDERRPPSVTLPGGRTLSPGRDVRTLAYSGAGRASGGVRAVGGLGCRAADFGALRDGEVALVQRGTCLLAVKARNAQAAGASAILIANDGGAIAGTLGAPGLSIPALVISGGAAQDVRAAGRATIAVDAVSERRRTANVLAETGDGPRVAMAGGHLDSVADGPGVNDNGSGVSALLAVAEALGGHAPQGARVRLAFWGAEELGLYGSRRYVAGLDRAEREAIAAYVNLDTVGTRGGRFAVYRGDDRIERTLRRALRERGRDDVGEESLGNASDHAPFARARIPVGGVFTGLDRCYHRACDGASNVDPRRVADAAAATAAALLELSS